MSSTLTWYSSGLGAKTGTAVGNLFTDFKTLFDSKAGDANFKWEVSASSLAGTPYYLWLRPKDGSAGRILFIVWSSGPAGNNSAILDGAPTTGNIYVAWFPNGTAASPSNLTASSGSISGDDTNCVKVAAGNVATTAYGTSFQPYYFECEEGIIFVTQNPASSANYWFAAGNLAVDANDVAYGITIGASTQTGGAFGASSSPCFAWNSAGFAAGVVSPGMKSNYSTQTSTTCWFQAFMPSGNWASVAISSTDVLSDTSNNDVWFVPMQLMASNAKGGGFPLKLRQIAMGPGTLSAFQTYQTTGPVVQARQICAATIGGNGHAWVTNFKV